MKRVWEPKTNWHLTTPKHYVLTIPPVKKHFYCFEEGNDNNTLHTHTGFALITPLTLKSLLDFLCLHNPEFKRENFQLDTHNQINSIIGYHYGLGDKPPCSPPPVWISPVDFNVQNFLENSKKSKKGMTPQQVADRNRLYLDENSNDLVDKGILSLLSKKRLSDNKRDYYNSQKKKQVLPDVDWSTLKCRHLWVADVASTGKTAMVKQLAASASTYFKDLTSNFWENYHGEQFVILNDFHGQFTMSDLKSWTDGGIPVPIKFGSGYLHENVVFIVTSNKSLVQTFEQALLKNPGELTPMIHRFNIIKARNLYMILRGSNLIPEYQKL